MKIYLFTLLSILCFSSCFFKSGKTEEELIIKWEQKKQEIPDAIGQPYLKSGIYYVENDSNDTNILKRTYRDSKISEYINPNPIVTSAELNEVTVSGGKENYYVNLLYNGNGSMAICEASTNQFINRGRLAFIIDNMLISAPAVNDGPLCVGSISISGFNNIEMALAIQSILRKEMRNNN